MNFIKENNLILGTPKSSFSYKYILIVIKTSHLKIGS